MRFYTRQHVHYWGIDLHARSFYLCILDQEGADEELWPLLVRKIPPKGGDRPAGVLCDRSLTISTRRDPLSQLL